MMIMRNQIGGLNGLNGPIGPPLSGPVSQPQIGPGATPLMNNSLMMHGGPGMHAIYRQRMNAPNPQVGDPVFVGGQPGVAGGPGPQFNPGGLNRMGQNKPGIGGSMMPPPSPAMNGAPKDNNGKDAGGNKGLGGPGGNNNPGSPRNQPPSNVGGSNGGGGTAPPTPVPGSQPNPQQQQQQQLGNQNPMNASPTSMMGVVPTGSGPGGGLVGGGNSGLGGPQPDLTTMFNPEFMSNMTSSMEEFGTPDFLRAGPDGDINFERDFGQWFINPDEVGSGLDMK